MNLEFFWSAAVSKTSRSASKTGPAPELLKSSTFVPAAAGVRRSGANTQPRSGSAAACRVRSIAAWKQGLR
jgi:hypothetical protein